ncbi:MAG: hypothetical protein ACYC8T_24240 [Myxococcaceae bacterium]
MNSKIDRSTFRSVFVNGIDVKDPKLAAKLSAQGLKLDDLKKLDLNRDGRLTGVDELNAAFVLVDRFDSDGSSRTFDYDGATEGSKLFEALVQSSGATAPNRFSAQLAAAAADRVTRFGATYGKDQACVSPNPKLTANLVPNSTKLAWTKGVWKCNQFVGDVLTQAGVKTPTYSFGQGKNQSVHYVEAEKWPQYPNLFDRVTDASEIQLGDILVKDYPDAGEAGGHIEVVTGLNPLRTTGAHYDRAYESGNGWLRSPAYFDAKKRCWHNDNGGLDLYVLRPKVHS